MRIFKLLSLRTLSAVSNSIFTKLIISLFPTFIFILVRNSLISCIGIIIIIAKQETRAQSLATCKRLLTEEGRWDLLNILLSGLMYTLSMSLGYIVMKDLPLSSLIVLSTTINLLISVVISKYHLREAIDKKSLIAIIPMIVGCTLLYGTGEPIATMGIPLGYLILILFFSSFLGIFDDVFTSKVSANTDLNTLTVFKTATSVPVSVVLAFLVFKESISDLSHITYTIPIIFSIICVLGVGYYLRYSRPISFALIGVHGTIAFDSIISAITVFASAMVFNNVFTITQWLGIAVVMGAFIFSRFEPSSFNRGKTKPSIN